MHKITKKIELDSDVLAILEKHVKNQGYDNLSDLVNRVLTIFTESAIMKKEMEQDTLS